ncbi:MAG: SusC/RagA family TonB-linked outer membrane protein [Prevotella sp.]
MSVNLKTFRIALLALFAMMSAVLSAQTVKGNVKDTNGDPIIGATVQEKGTKNISVTDLDGNFTLKTSGKQQIQISYIGMKSKTVNAEGKSSISVVLEDEATTLNDVVVIGYGAVKRKDLTGSVATVSSEAIAAVPVANATEALQGKLAGVNITTTEGSPDAEMKIRVRGGGSITQSNEPLYIVDGFPVSSISDIAPSDIEDITVLKDASSTAIYGARGANGVILITTKSGKEGKLSVNYNFYYSFKKLADKLDVLNAKDYVKWQYEAEMLKSGSSTINPSSYTKFFGNYADMDMYDNIATNDWQDIVFGRTGHTQNHSLSINGGSDKIKFTFSYNRINDRAIMVGSDYKRDNLSLKLNAKPSKNLKFDFSVRYAKIGVDGSGMNEQNTMSSSDARLKHCVIYTPFPVAGLSDDAVADGETDPDFNLYNPLENIADNDQRQDRAKLNMAGSLTWEIIKNLNFKSEFGYDTDDKDVKRFYGLTTYYVKNTPSSENKEHPAAIFTNTNHRVMRNTNTLSYDFKKLIKGDDHHLNMMVGQEYIVDKSVVKTNTVHGYPVNYTADKAFKLANVGDAYEIKNYYNPDDKLLSFFGRVNYDYQSKYLFSATFRADGSSKFSKGNQWGYFPSAAVAWRLSSEKFMKGAEKWIDDLKLRLSYGTAGNNGIPAGYISPAYEANTTAWINGFDNYWAASKTLANPDLKWETTITRNLGLDFTLFGSKLTGSFEYYWNTTKDLLIKFNTEGIGYDNQYRNMGETENKGFEANVTWHAINNKNFTLAVNANVGFNKNKIKSLGIMNDFTAESGWLSTLKGKDDYMVRVGGSVGEMYGYRCGGRYEVSDFERYDEATKKWILKPGVADASSVIGSIRPGTMKILSTTQYWDSESGVWRDRTTGEEVTKNAGIVSEADQQIIGNANPKCTGGFGINMTFYGFDLAANFNWSIGNDIYNANKIEFTQTGGSKYRNLLNIMAEGNRWTNLNPDGTICNDMEQLAAMNANTTMWSPYSEQKVFTDWAVEDGSFLRLNTLTLGYTVPKSLTQKLHIQNLRFYITGYNVFCWTNYSGADPEVSTRRSTELTPGVDYSAYPKSRSLVLGLNLNF